MEENAALMYLLVILLVAVFGMLCIYLYSMSEVLKKCRRDSRAMKPESVFLMLIPVFGMFWQFKVVIGIAQSLEKEFVRLEIPHSEPFPGQTLGLAMCVCNCVSLVPIPLLSGSVGIVGLVLWIIYWVKISGYSKLLRPWASSPPAAMV